MFAKLGGLGEASVFHVPVHIPEYSPDHNRSIKLSRDKQKNQAVPSECHHTSIHDSKRGCGGLASEEKVVFVLKLLEPVLPVHSHRFHKRNI